MGLRPSRKIAHHCVQFHGFVLKKHFLRHPGPFHGADHEWYNDKAIEHLHLYVFEEASRCTITHFASS